ncbi:hypothetical protein [Nostoc sphaeroides]|uniref:Uncharacterized protein n=1 Tax=Nostoc sphaeroides CCNUC1 TaxID=2653204 RepID=A0A5P8W358_9NOSO|nr:hypothetical protein [Nostoc sphaeroides]MCC5631049.1 hypothetical protein [Nostoc sphaeroides CHAB 2801]QFS47167.1 hypothetical protein GXM_04657 [Nostoc sphaeroides CCNUC1]
MSLSENIIHSAERSSIFPILNAQHLEIGDWGLVTGIFLLMPNPQSPIPNPLAYFYAIACSHPNLNNYP